MTSYPVVFDVVRPPRWERVQLLLRLAIGLLLAIVHASLGWLFGVLYLILPIAAAAMISQNGAEAYLARSAKPVVSLLRGWNAFVAYLFFLTDRPPLDEPSIALVRFEVTPSGAPSVGRALTRLLTSLPELVVLAVLSCLASFVWLIAAIAVLINEQVPRFAYQYLRFVVALQARLLAYHASLTDLYPPLDAPAHGAS